MFAVATRFLQDYRVLNLQYIMSIDNERETLQNEGNKESAWKIIQRFVDVAEEVITKKKRSMSEEFL